MTVRGNGLPGFSAKFAVGSVRLGGDVAEAAEELVDGSLAVFGGGAFVVGEWDVDQHPLQVVPGLDELAGAGCVRSMEVAAGADHPMWALFEEGGAAARRLRPAWLGISRFRADSARNAASSASHSASFGTHGSFVNLGTRPRCCPSCLTKVGQFSSRTVAGPDRASGAQITASAAGSGHRVIPHDFKDAEAANVWTRQLRPAQQRVLGA